MGRRSARVEEGAFVVEGPGLIAAAHDAGWEIEAVFVAAGADPAIAPAGLVVHELGPGVIEKAASTEAPQASMAIVRRRTSSLDDVRAATFVVVGDRIADPGNAGTMLRSAEAAGADAVVLTSGSVDVFNPKVVRASAGALFHVPVVVDVSLAEVAAAGPCRLVGTSSHVGSPYTDVDLTGAMAVVVGNEAHGLPADAPVDVWVTIPHVGRAESLNVAMATTVVVFEAARQRRVAANRGGG
ncbi:MAG: RNA methyltransferase [Ilumatobacteraceae bacterium]|nr:RNA methyltransferase [Acidimicrobiales bacterium]MCB9395423.1 RNA methyltransferase [Acidimicrobiaceae bacterium]